MPGIRMTDLDRDGELIAGLFKAELESRGRGADSWTIYQNGEGITIRHSAATEGDEPLFIDSVSYRVEKAPDYEYTDAIRRYLRVVLVPDGA